MQYENASVVSIDVRHRETPHVDLEHPQLTLSVSPGSYHVRSKGARGGGGEFHLEFVIIPALADDLNTIKFELVKSAEIPRYMRPSIVLEQPVSFT